MSKGQLISKQNCQASIILSAFCLFFWEKLRIDNFVSRSKKEKETKNVIDGFQFKAYKLLDPIK